jgi:DnaK suppressor protein
MATDTKNTAPAAAETKPAQGAAQTTGAAGATKPAQAPRKASGATPESNTKAARTTARKPRSRRTTAKSARKPAARRTPGATAARPTLGRPAARPAATPQPAPEPVAAAAEAPATFGGSLLDAVESAGTRVADYHEQVAEATPLPWVAEVARANAHLTRIVTRAYVSSSRTLLRG